MYIIGMNSKIVRKHYPPSVSHFVTAMYFGGSEKLRGEEDAHV